MQTQVGLLKTEFDLGLPCLLFWPAICEFQPSNPPFYLRRKGAKSYKIWTIYHTLPTLILVSEIRADQVNKNFLFLSKNVLPVQ